LSLLALAAVAALALAGCGADPPRSPDVPTIGVATTAPDTTTSPTKPDTTTYATTPGAADSDAPGKAIPPRPPKRLPAARIGTPPVSTPRPAPKPRPKPVHQPKPAPKPKPRSSCDPSYPTVCLPAGPPDLDCPQISARRFPVHPPDSHGFDNDNDGIGCESG